MDAVVTAGGIPQPDELLYPFTQGKPKALLDICGKPMIQWVLDALSESQSIENVVLIGLTEETNLVCSKPITYIPNKDFMIENILGGIRKLMEINPSGTRAMIVSSDIPGITPEIVNWEVETTLQYDVDLCYNVVKREVIEAALPRLKANFLEVERC